MIRFYPVFNSVTEQKVFRQNRKAGIRVSKYELFGASKEEKFPPKCLQSNIGKEKTALQKAVEVGKHFILFLKINISLFIKNATPASFLSLVFSNK